MKNKNGFIATSVMFAFFLVFVALSTLVITSYAHYDSLINALNGNILQTLNEDIKKKYTTVTNCIKNGDLANGANNWSFTGASRFADPTYNNNYIRVAGGNTAIISQNIGNCLKKQGTSRKKVYVVFKLNLSNFKCSSSLTLNYNGANTISNALCTATQSFVNWQLTSFIMNTSDVDSSNESLTFNVSATTGNYLGIEDIMVVDITRLYKDQSCLNNNNCDITMKQYLDKNLPYFNDTYSLEKF